MKTKRAYTMGARADAVQETRKRILESAFGLADTKLFTEITLDEVARGAGVSVQTVLRQFGSRDGLVDATMAYAERAVSDERETPVGDPAAAVRVIVDHYERRGRTALLMLAQEDHDATVAGLTSRGKAMHRSWVETAFAPFVRAADPSLDLLVVATDVYTWKLLRLDRGLSRAQTQKRMLDLVDAILAQVGKDSR
ncbi:TetR/AcrR family transcriptional regulator [Nocardioides pelophilus]|uniref:TetR/AcrR family transcriptional regulator n=1 Tax=Nocardioides pelophilus TaxID=2172019 RepID=UPI001601F96F|nr:TetR/AcrR family transcriptional regulator [Nocardioides pelophilus]